MKTPYSTASIPDELLARNTVEEAIGGFNMEASLVAQEEVLMLYQGERRNNPTGLRVVWDEFTRNSKKQLQEQP